MCRLPYPSASPQSKLAAQRAGSLCHTRARSFAHFGACCFGINPCSHVQEHCLPRCMDLRGTSPYPSASPGTAAPLCGKRYRHQRNIACTMGLRLAYTRRRTGIRNSIRGCSRLDSCIHQMVVKSSSACRRLCSPRCTQARSSARFAACCCMSPCCRARGRRLPLYTETCGRSLRCRPRSKNRCPASLAPAGETSDRQESRLHTSRARRSLHLWCSSM